MSLPHGETITITRPAARDRFGDRPAGDPTSTQVDGVGFAFDSSAASWPLDGEDRGLGEATLFLPDGTDLQKGDVVTRVVDGTRWHVAGPPQWNRSVHPMTGWSAGMFTQRIRRTD